MALELMDLSAFGIHFNNPGNLCCRKGCGRSVRGYTEAIFADELCGRCATIPTRVGSRTPRVGRRAIFYRPTSVLVMLPTSVQSVLMDVWGRKVELPGEPGSYSCLVRIDGQFYFGRCVFDSSVALERRDGKVRTHGLQLSQERLERIYLTPRSR